MDDITKIDNLLHFLLRTTKIECDSSCGSDISIPVHDIAPEEFLSFADHAISSCTKEGIVNAISNLKRALDCEIDMFFESIHLKSIFDKKNLKFEKKSQFLADIGLFPVQTINKLNAMRNKMEHEYKVPEISDLHAYYELVWSVVKIVDLHLELMYVNGEIDLSLKSDGRTYSLLILHDVHNCAFKFEVYKFMADGTYTEAQLTVGLKDQHDAADFIKAFSLYLSSIQYFNRGNEKLYREKIKRLQTSV